MTAKSRSRIRVLVPPLALALVALGGLGLGEIHSNAGQNIILISIDTCRPDRLSCYGYEHNTTPNIDELAAGATLCSNAYSPVPMTLPAHASMLTGTIPPTHGIRGNLDQQLARANVTIAEVLSSEGYVTGAVVGSHVLSSNFGLDQGFDYYNDEFEESTKASFGIERPGDEVTRVAIEWLEKNKNDGFFLFLHYYDPHYPYDSPEPFASRFRQEPYAGEVAYADFCVGRVMDWLKEFDLYESSLIVIVGDHGEMLGEHGEDEHMYFIYESAIRVPLIFKLPGQTEGMRVDETVGVVDIVPTVCGILGINTPDRTEGMDLSRRLLGGPPVSSERCLYAESIYAARYGANPLVGIVANGWKYISTTRPELYDLNEDPGESTNLIDREPELAQSLEARLDQILDESKLVDEDGTRTTFDTETTAKLRSLGYIGGSGNNRLKKLDPDLPDPKDLVAFHNMVLRADQLILDERYGEAGTVCEEMLRMNSRSFDTHHFLAKIAQAEGRNQEAISHLEDAVRLQPEEPRLQYELASALLEAGRDDEAMSHLYSSLQLKPWSCESRISVGIVLANQGRLAEAAKMFEEALASNPRAADAHYELGCALGRMGRTHEAIHHFSETLLLDPTHANAHNNLGVELARQGNLNRAIAHFAEALKIDPEDEGIQSNFRRAMSQRPNN